MTNGPTCQKEIRALNLGGRRELRENFMARILQAGLQIGNSMSFYWLRLEML
jgi:hypothetical protein